MNSGQNKAGYAALRWFKSSYSSGEGGDCIEIAVCSHTVHIRDSKLDPRASGRLDVTPAAWAAFLRFAPSSETRALLSRNGR
ncbi:DUF397 domain-containing protein [Streptomyces triculaminicus]|uniref:DUF397 domain-containing protein n=1 Tax=Streptomyces triculaminicus TaxID=2816232 RepID=UPI0037D24C1F